MLSPRDSDVALWKVAMSSGHWEPTSVSPSQDISRRTLKRHPVAMAADDSPRVSFLRNVEGTILFI